MVPVDDVKHQDLITAQSTIQLQQRVRKSCLSSTVIVFGLAEFSSSRFMAAMVSSTVLPLVAIRLFHGAFWGTSISENTRFPNEGDLGRLVPYPPHFFWITVSRVLGHQHLC